MSKLEDEIMEIIGKSDSIYVQKLTAKMQKFTTSVRAYLSEFNEVPVSDGDGSEAIKKFCVNTQRVTSEITGLGDLIYEQLGALSPEARGEADFLLTEKDYHARRSEFSSQVGRLMRLFAEEPGIQQKVATATLQEPLGGPSLDLDHRVEYSSAIY